MELADMLCREHGASFATSTIWRFLDRHAMTFKKTAHASEQNRPDVAARRQAWFNAQPDLDPEHLVFIDETGASTKMARLRGRATRGDVADRRFHTGIGKPQPSPAPCGCPALPRQWSSTGR